MTINVFGGGFNPAAPAFPVQRSVRLRSSASANFSRTPANATNRKTWTWSGWVKRGALGVNLSIMGAQAASTSGTQRFNMYFAATTDTLVIADDSINISTSLQLITTQVFRDPSAWYHIVLAVDTTQATSSNRVKLYINGTQVTSFSTATYPSLNFDTAINNNVAQYLGYYNNLGTTIFYYDGYITEVNFIDGQALTPTSFGSINSTTGVWQPIKYSGTYGTNGFYLNFNDNSAATAAAIGKDSSGNGNNWTPNNISVTAGVTYDSMLDVPTLTSANNANFCTLNPLSKQGVTLSDGNLGFSGTSVLASGTTFAFPLSGKWYAEFQITTTPENNTNELVGIGAIATTGNIQRAYASNGQYFNGSAWVAFGSAWSINDIIAFACDIDNSQISVYKNNTLQGTIQSYTFSENCWQLRARSTGTTTMNANFGQRPFTYTPPSGFKSLNTYNLPAPTIPNGATQFAVSLWSGNNSTQSITNTVNGKSFQPDLVWLKQRSPTGTGHILEDSVRGALQYLGSESTAAESTIAGTVTAFNSNGFSIGSQAGTNATGSTYVGWQWKAGGTAVTNTAGSITSSVSANPSAGFSIVTYTGTGANATVGHGLGVAPKMVIVKARNFGSATDWAVYHSNLTSAAYAVFLNTTGAQSNAASWWNSTAPTSSVFSIGTSGGAINGSGTNYVAYCFSEITGYSKAFSYTGNGSTDGVFSYLGFRPRMILLKRTDTTGNWYIWDTSRNTYNVVGEELYPNLSNAAATATDLDLLSNGFKLRNSTAGFNASGGTYVGFAWAESPFNYSLAI